MKRKLISLALALCMLVASFLPCVYAADVSAQSTALKTVQALEIIKGDTNGNLNLESKVTRAEFLTMMVRASAYKDEVASEGSGYSLFKDVKSSYWASPYIKLAIDRNWVTGYVDGTFRPATNINLECACTVALKLLGYDTASLTGSFPYAQLNKASALGITDNVGAAKGQDLTRQQCVTLIYNMLNAKTAQGQIYAETLGYSVTDGIIDYTSALMSNFKGPFIAAKGEQLNFTPKTVYRNGEISTNAALSENDVYYYNQATSSLWIYDEKAVGKIAALSPSSESPTSVTVAGVTYSIGTAEAQYELSVLGGISKGDVVTLLLGLDDTVAGVLSGNAVDQIYYGVVTSYTKSGSSDAASVETTVTMICTDGVSRSFAVSKDTSYTTGQIICVNTTDAGVSVSLVSGRGLSGKINSDATKLGNYTLASDVEILDTATDGSAVKVKPERLAGVSLSTSNVRAYTLNSSGEIEMLILNDVTGDIWSYGYLTSASENSSASMQFSKTYTYLMNGKESTLNVQNTSYPVTESAGFAVKYGADGSVKGMRALSSSKLTTLGTMTAQAGNTRYTLSDDVQVYFKQDGAYYATTLSNVNTTDYTLTGWYDNFGCPAGGQIRVIMAVKK